MTFADHSNSSGCYQYQEKISELEQKLADAVEQIEIQQRQLRIFDEAQGNSNESTTSFSSRSIIPEPGKYTSKDERYKIYLMESNRSLALANQNLGKSNRILNIANQQLTNANRRLRQEMEHRKLAEQALRESGEQIKNMYQTLTQRANELEAAHLRIFEILDSIQDPFYTIDSEWRLTYVNQKAESFWGIDRNELIGRIIWDIFPEAVGSDSFRQIQRAMNERQVCHYETISLVGNTWIEVHAYPTRDGGLTVYFRDIDDRKSAEKALRESEERFNKAFDVSPVGLVISLKDNGQIQEVNESFERIFGYSREEVIGKNSIDLGVFVNPSDRAKAVHRLDQEGSVCDFELEIRTKAGDIRQASLSISPIVVDNHNFMLTSIQDVTERKRAEAELRDRSDRLAFLSDAAGELLRGNDPIILMEHIFPRLSALIDLDIYFYYLVSQDQSHLELAAFSGLPAVDRLQVECLEFGQAVCGQAALSQQPVLSEDIQNSAEERTDILRKLGINSYVCYPLISREHLIGTLSFGSRRRIHFTKESLSLFQAVCDLFVTAVERKRGETELKEFTEKVVSSNQELQQFAYIASHDLQEPLRKIEAFSGLLLGNSSGLDENQIDHLKRVQSASERMRGMVDGLLGLSRVTTQGQPFQLINLSEIAAEALSDLEIQVQRTGGKVKLGELPSIVGDPLQIRRLLQNLIGNALKYHREGIPPVVKIYKLGTGDQGIGTSKELSTPNPLVTNHQSRSNEVRAVTIIIEDNGIGFHQGHAVRLFQPFQRLVGKSEYEGSGMGLAICRRIVERHGGEITAKSEPGKGAMFLVTLPVRAEKNEEK